MVIPLPSPSGGVGDGLDFAYEPYTPGAKKVLGLCKTALVMYWVCLLVVTIFMLQFPRDIFGVANAPGAILYQLYPMIVGFGGIFLLKDDPVFNGCYQVLKQGICGVCCTGGIPGCSLHFAILCWVSGFFDIVRYWDRIPMLMMRVKMNSQGPKVVQNMKAFVENMHSLRAQAGLQSLMNNLGASAGQLGQTLEAAQAAMTEGAPGDGSGVAPGADAAKPADEVSAAGTAVPPAQQTQAAQAAADPAAGLGMGMGGPLRTLLNMTPDQTNATPSTPEMTGDGSDPAANAMMAAVGGGIPAVPPNMNIEAVAKNGFTKYVPIYSTPFLLIVVICVMSSVILQVLMGWFAWKLYKDWHQRMADYASSTQSRGFEMVAPPGRRGSENGGGSGLSGGGGGNSSGSGGNSNRSWWGSGRLGESAPSQPAGPAEAASSGTETAGAGGGGGTQTSAAGAAAERRASATPLIPFSGQGQRLGNSPPGHGDGQSAEP